MHINDRIIGLLAIGLGLTLLLTTRSAGDSYDLSAAKAVNAELAQQRASLQRDVELAESTPELARKAAELGMVPVKNSAHLIVAPDGCARAVVAGPAEWASPDALRLIEAVTAVEPATGAATGTATGADKFGA